MGVPLERNVVLVLEYDGTRYHGFQVQAGNLPTIQGELERAIEQITGLRARISGAGRTDRGVHASGQVANFYTGSALSTGVLRRALNAVLPPDIAVISAAEAPSNFHARFSARSREYRYTIVNRPARSPLMRHFAYHLARPLDVAAMAEAARELVGEHDFASFAGGSEEVESTVRNVLSADCQREGERVYVDIEANAFLPHMVRNIVGTLLLIGIGKLEMDGFRQIFAARQRREAGPTAPAHGLCLTRVNY
jgi:tRNA pseudouridine38-40 synthase